MAAKCCISTENIWALLPPSPSRHHPGHQGRAGVMDAPSPHKQKTVSLIDTGTWGW